MPWLALISGGWSAVCAAAPGVGSGAGCGARGRVPRGVRCPVVGAAVFCGLWRVVLPTIVPNPRDGLCGAGALSGLCSLPTALPFKLHQSRETKLMPRGQKNVPRLQLGAIRHGKCLSIYQPPFPSDANFPSNVYFQGT